jgi:hypothetical protein
MATVTDDRRDGPSAKALEEAAQVVAEELTAQHPGWLFTVHRPGEPAPPGAITIPLSSRPVHDEPVRRDR